MMNERVTVAMVAMVELGTMRMRLAFVWLCEGRLTEDWEEDMLWAGICSTTYASSRPVVDTSIAMTVSTGTVFGETASKLTV
jgi:hypothetical protein